MMKKEEQFTTEIEYQKHIQDESQAERVAEYGTAARYRNYSDLQTGAPGANVKNPGNIGTRRLG